MNKKLLAGAVVAAGLVAGAVGVSRPAPIMEQHRTCVPWPACIKAWRVCYDAPRGRTCNTEDVDGGE